MKKLAIALVVLVCSLAFAIECTNCCALCSGNTGGGTTTSCTITVNCVNGSVSCTSVNNDCVKGSTYVTCDKKSTYC